MAPADARCSSLTLIENVDLEQYECTTVVYRAAMEAVIAGAEGSVTGLCMQLPTCEHACSLSAGRRALAIAMPAIYSY